MATTLLTRYILYGINAMKKSFLFINLCKLFEGKQELGFDQMG